MSKEEFLKNVYPCVCRKGAYSDADYMITASYLDLDVYFRVFPGGLSEELESNGFEAHVSCYVVDGMVPCSPNELMKAAMENAVGLYSMYQFMGSLNIVTNPAMYLGGSAILFPDVFKKICEEELPENPGKLLILPSSIHELIILPYDQITVQEATDMVQQVNVTEVAEDEVLENHPYVYDYETNTITIA